MNPPDEPTPPKPIHPGWFLAAPWIVAVLILVGMVSGAANWFTQAMPFGLGRYGARDSLSGLGLFTIICSALWARRKAQAGGKRDDERVAYVIGTTIWLTLAQAAAMGGLFFVGCSFVIFNKW